MLLNRRIDVATSHRYGILRILADAGITELPILGWFHIGMRLNTSSKQRTALLDLLDDHRLGHHPRRIIGRPVGKGG